VPDHALITGQYRPAADAFERLDDGGRPDRRATEEARIGGVAAPLDYRAG